MKKVKVIGIKWDADNLEDVKHLPTEMILDVPSHVEDEDDLEAFIADKLSNQAGFTHDGWKKHELIELVEECGEMANEVLVENTSFVGLPELFSIRDVFLTYVGEWANKQDCRTGKNRANGTAIYLRDGLYLYEFKTREDAYKYLFEDDRSIPYAFAEYDEDESEENGEETFGEWEFNNGFNPIWLNAELEEFMQKNILSDEEKDALVAEIYSWHESCEQGQEGECKIFDAIERGASDDEVILIAFDVDRDLFDKFEKPTPRYCIVQNTKEEGSSTLEDYDNLESAMEAYDYIKENGCHKSEENDGEIIPLESGTEISMDIEWWDLKSNCLVKDEGMDVPVITIQ